MAGIQMKRPSDIRPLDPYAIENAQVHQMYASNIPGLTHEKLILDLGALIQHGGKNQLIAAAQIVKEMKHRNDLLK